MNFFSREKEVFCQNNTQHEYFSLRFRRKRTCFCLETYTKRIVHKTFVAPGNAGTAQIAQNVALNPNDFETIKQFVIANAIEMVVVGPEDPLVNGVYDFSKTMFLCKTYL